MLNSTTAGLLVATYVRLFIYFVADEICMIFVDIFLCPLEHNFLNWSVKYKNIVYIFDLVQVKIKYSDCITSVNRFPY